MSQLAISVDSVSKKYRLGSVGRQTLREDVSRAWARLCGRPDPSLRVGDESNADGDAAEIWALRDISCDVNVGEVVGLIGENGAGKSTLLKILSRITTPTTGEVRMRGRLASLLEVGTGFHPELTGRENIFLNGAIMGLRHTEIRSRFDEIVAFSGVEKYIDTPVKRYSSGMYVRLAFAVGAHLESEILVVDEVLAVGDSGFQKKCLGKMEDVAKQGRTVLFVSHNMQAINALCDRGILLKHGRIDMEGPATRVTAKYLETFVSESIDRREQCWSDIAQAPGNDRIRLRRVAIVPDDDTTLLDVRTSFRVEIEFWNLEPGARIIVNLVLYAYDGQPAFEVHSVTDANWHGRPFPSGLFRTACRVPAHLLNEGTYRLRTLFIDDSPRSLYDNRDAARFTVHDMADREFPWFGKFVGFVRPRLQWETDYLAELIDVESGVTKDVP
jgi:lipopolysaccharide transport system ATP-binding protein